MEITNKKRDLFIGFGLLALLFVVLIILEHTIRPTSILFTVFGIEIAVNCLQYMNALCPIEVTPTGMFISEIAVEPNA